MGAAATGGGSLRGKSAAAATLSMAKSPAVTMMTIFMMLIPLCWAPGRADRVTPLFRLSVEDARFCHPTFRLDRRGEWLPTICRFGDGLVQMRLGGSQGRRLTKRSWPAAMAKSRFIVTHSFTVRLQP